MSKHEGTRGLVRTSAAVLAITALAGCGNNETQAVDMPDLMLAQTSLSESEAKGGSSGFVAEWNADTEDAHRVIISCRNDGQPGMNLQTRSTATSPFDQLEVDDKNLTTELPDICADGTIAGPQEAADALQAAVDEKRLYDETR